MSEYQRLRTAFVRACGEPVREPPNQVDDDGRSPDRICWIARNVWRFQDDPNGRDVQINAWHGTAWVSYNAEQMAGLWCGLNIEYKPAFEAVLQFINAESMDRIAQTIDGYRVSFGRKRRFPDEFIPIDCGRHAGDIDYQDMLLRIRQLTFDGDSRSRPQVQVYRQIGHWLDASNSVDRLADAIIAVRSELSELFRLVTGGSYPPRD